jgi:hypothetical protein
MKTVFKLVAAALVVCGLMFVWEKVGDPLYCKAVDSYNRHKAEEAARARAEGRLPANWTSDDLRACLDATAERAGYKVSYTRIGRGGRADLLKKEEWTARMPNSPSTTLSEYLVLAGECYLVIFTDANGSKKGELVIKNLDDASKLRVFVRFPGEWADRADGTDAQKVLSDIAKELN